MKNYFSDLFYDSDMERSLRFNITPENAQRITGEAEDLQGIMLENIRNISSFMSITLRGEGPSNEIVSGCTQALTMMADLADILEAIEVKAQEAIPVSK